MKKVKNNKFTIAIDVMGGDNPPSTIIEGAVQAARESNVSIILVGLKEIIKAELRKYNDAKELSISICNAEQVIEMHESPAQACKLKRNSSVMICAGLVGERQADAYISAGNSGATMTSSLLKLKRIGGVKRPAIATLMPTLLGKTVIIDSGANVDSKAEHLFQFASMGSIYAKAVLNKKNPKVGLLTIGEEDKKGNELTLKTFELLKNSNLNFVGNIEGQDIHSGKCDVVICDGFVGNIVLKLSEGAASLIIEFFKRAIKKTFIRKIGAILMLRVLADLKMKLDPNEYGGAPLLGTKGVTVICHGSSDSKGIKNAVKVAVKYIANDINKAIAKAFETENISN
ncbi:phosphate acyltransferase PlsX [bacterium]